MSYINLRLTYLLAIDHTRPTVSRVIWRWIL